MASSPQKEWEESATFDNVADVDYEQGADPEYDEGAQPGYDEQAQRDFDDDVSDPDAGGGGSQEWYARKQK